MNFVNMKSKVAHYPDCHLVSRIADVNLGCYESTFYAAKDGFRVCKCCDPMVRRLSKREAEMTEYCEARAITYRIENGELMITTPYSKWKAYVGDGDQFILYHKNTRSNSGYHLQTKRYTDVMALLRYIDHHDEYRLYNPLPEDRERKQKSAPKKGTKRYRSAMKKANNKKRRREINNVLNLIDSLSASAM